MKVNKILMLLVTLCILSSCDKDDINDDNVKERQEVKDTTSTDVDTKRTFTIGGVSFNMIKVEGGSFIMGCQNTDKNEPYYDNAAFDAEVPYHKVTVSSFYIGETEVTQALWYAVTKNQHSSWEKYGKGDNYPVNCKSWDEINEIFFPALNDSLHQSGQLSENENIGFPTEAQWEFAAKGGNKSHGYMYAGSNDLNDVGWYVKNNESEYYSEVGLKKPNELGLYDMSGNICELVFDRFTYYTSEDQIDPVATVCSLTNRDEVIVKGGDFDMFDFGCRTTFRNCCSTTFKYRGDGFRMAIALSK